MKIINVLMETGWHQLSEREIETQTGLYTLFLTDGKIVEITEQAEYRQPEPDQFDAEGYLIAPTLKDFHIHLDKGHYGGPWKASIPMSSVAERIREEQGFLRDFLKLLPQRADSVLKLIQSYGCDFMRVQVNVDPVIGLENLFLVRDVLNRHSTEMDFDLVAFPQHGLLATEQERWISRALEAGCHRIGGVDPATLDMDIERVLTMTFDLAKAYSVPIDLHLHDGGELGNFEIRRILDYVEKYDMAGKVAISHALSLGSLQPPQLRPLAQRLADLDVVINTTLPLRMAGSFQRTVPWPELLAAGVEVHVINDNINDHWSPFGTGDLLERASRAAEIYGQSSEQALNYTYRLVSGGMTTLDADGKLLWPQVGDVADFLLLDCSCLAEAVARVPCNRKLFHHGKLVNTERPNYN